MTFEEFKALAFNEHEGDLKNQRSLVTKLAEETLDKTSPKGTIAEPDEGEGSIHIKEYGTPGGYKVVIDVENLKLIEPVATADLADGHLLYTLPDIDLIITNASIAIGVEGSGEDDNNEDDTPVVGLGTTKATGAVALLNGTAAFQNIMAGQALADCKGARKLAGVATILTVADDGDHSIFLNIADGWADEDDGMLATGRIIIEWKPLS